MKNRFQNISVNGIPDKTIRIGSNVRSYIGIQFLPGFLEIHFSGKYGDVDINAGNNQKNYKVDKRYFPKKRVKKVFHFSGLYLIVKPVTNAPGG
jgi:hypothetical protein